MIATKLEIQKKEILAAKQAAKPITRRTQQHSLVDSNGRLRINHDKNSLFKRTVNIPKTVPEQIVWKKLWSEGKHIETIVSKMKELAASNVESFKDLFEKLLEVISN